MVDRKQRWLVVATMLAIVLGIVAAEIVILSHPFGYAISVLVGVMLALGVPMAVRRFVRGRFRPSEYQNALDEVTGEILKSTDDPNEPARWVP